MTPDQLRRIFEAQVRYYRRIGEVNEAHAVLLESLLRENDPSALMKEIQDNVLG